MNAETPKRSNPPIHRDPFAKGDDPRRNRTGRTGSRAKLGKRFFEDMYAAWEEQGEAVIARAMFHDPVAVLGVVARLMPQKIEVSTPTDGMSDERLAEMLELAERMASLKATGAMAHNINVIEAQTVAPLLPSADAACHEKSNDTNGAIEGGGGPFRLGSVQAENTAHALRPPPADEPEPEHNKVCHIDSENNTVASLPYPVGAASSPTRPCPKCGAPMKPVEIHSCRRCERVALADGEIDPASLF